MGWRSLAERSSSAAELMAPQEETTTSAAVDLGRALAVDDHRGDAAAALVGLEALDVGVTQERDVRVLERGPHGADVGVGLAVGEAGEAVELGAAHALALLGVLLVHVHSHRQVEGVVAAGHEIVVQLLDARLVRDGRVRELARAPGLGGVLAGASVHQVEPLGLGVVGLEVGIGERPGRGDAAVMVDLLEVALAQAEEDRAVELGVAAHEVLRVGLEGRAVLVVPGLAREVAALEEDLRRVPVLGLARGVAAALEQQDALAARRQAVGERSAARTASDDDHVVVLAHCGPPQTSAIGDVQAPVAPRSLGWVRISANSRTPAAASSERSRFSTMNTPCLR